jgi:hypothetical protein
LTLAFGGLCLYATLFSNLLRDAMMGALADRTSLDQFYTFTGWTIAFVIAIMFISLIYLVLYGIDAGISRQRRKPLACPECGLVEDRRSVRFKREPVEDTADLDKLTCPRCLNSWFKRG